MGNTSPKPVPVARGTHAYSMQFRMRLPDRESTGSRTAAVDFGNDTDLWVECIEGAMRFATEIAQGIIHISYVPVYNMYITLESGGDIGIYKGSIRWVSENTDHHILDYSLRWFVENQMRHAAYRRHGLKAAFKVKGVENRGETAIDLIPYGIERHLSTKWHHAAPVPREHPRA